MNILAFDTSLGACSVALLKNNEQTSLHHVAPMQQAKLILPMIQQLLTDNALTLSQLDAIAYGCGPGSFTGIRIASSVAQGLGFGLNLPLIPISSLAALAQTALDASPSLTSATFVVAVDARMGQLYSAMYQSGANALVELVGTEQLVTPEELIIKINENVKDNRQSVGDGWIAYQTQLKQSLTLPSLDPTILVPHAQSLLKLAVLKWREKAWIRPAMALPAYLR